MNAAALASLARAPSPPAGVRIETLQLENQTTLSWRANPEPDLAGYEIVWRETTAPFWQGAEFVGNVTRAQRAAVEGRLPVLGARSRRRRAAQPRHLSADTAQSPGACTVGLASLPGLALPASAQRYNRAFHPARAFVARISHSVASVFQPRALPPRMHPISTSSPWAARYNDQMNPEWPITGIQCSTGKGLSRSRP